MLAKQDNWERTKTHFQELKDIVGVLEQFLTEVEEHRREILQLAALGITSESFAHELVREVKEGLEQLKEIRKTIRKEKFSVKEADEHLRHLQGVLQTLLKQAAELEPQLKYVREQKETVPLAEFITKFQALNAPRLANRHISLVADLSQMSDEAIEVNYGKLSLVFANLVDNSQYWVSKRLQSGKIKQGEIAIRAKGFTVSIEDNGPGISPDVENSLFEAFETRKPRGEGRGLGLFICRQILESIGCAIDLDGERNADGRMFRFIVDLGGIAKA